MMRYMRRFALLGVLAMGAAAWAAPSHVRHVRPLLVMVASPGRGSFLIQLNSTTESSVEKRFGSGRATIGFHPNSARQWRLAGGGYFTVDGASGETNTDSSRPGYVADHILFDATGGKTTDPVLRGNPSFDGLQLGSSEADIRRILGAPAAPKTIHYDLPCAEWRWGKGADEQTADIAFRNGKAILISVDGCRE